MQQQSSASNESKLKNLSISFLWRHLRKCEHNPGHTEVYDKTHTDALNRFFSPRIGCGDFLLLLLKKKAFLLGAGRQDGNNKASNEHKKLLLVQGAVLESQR